MKRILIIIPSLIPLLLLSACADKKPFIGQMPPAISGTTLVDDELESVRYGENLKAYPMGRYIDPNDGLVMHEAHTVYRVETTAKWNLHPNLPVPVPSGPIIGLIDPAHKTSPVTPEIVAEMNRQQAATAALLAQGGRMDQAVSQLTQTLTLTAQVSADNARLQHAAALTEKRLAALEETFRETHPETTFNAPATPSVKGTNDW